MGSLLPTAASTTKLRSCWPTCRATGTKRSKPSNTCWLVTSGHRGPAAPRTAQRAAPRDCRRGGRPCHRHPLLRRRRPFLRPRWSRCSLTASTQCPLGVVGRGAGTRKQYAPRRRWVQRMPQLRGPRRCPRLRQLRTQRPHRRRGPRRSGPCAPGVSCYSTAPTTPTARSTARPRAALSPSPSRKHGRCGR